MATGAVDAAHFERRYARLLRHAWSDEDFCARIAADPASTLARYGLALPPGVVVRAEFVDEGNLDLGRLASSWAAARLSGEFTLRVPAVLGTHMSNDDLLSIIGGSLLETRDHPPVVYLTAR
jgi:hypothetical protein